MVDIKEILRRSSENTILLDKHPLMHEYLPGEIPHRDAEIERITTYFSDAVNIPPPNIIVYGKSGTGKTLVLKAIKEAVETEKKDVAIPYISCRQFNTEYRALFAIIRQLAGEKKKIPSVGWPKDIIYGALLEAIDQSRHKIITVVLDEIDAMRSPSDILYKLSRINSDLHNARVNVIAISNDTKIKQELETQVISSLGRDKIIFHPYSKNQLVDILTERVELAFKKNSVEKEAVELCASTAAQENGDARFALDILRRGGEIAIRQKRTKITQETIKQSIKTLQEDAVVSTISSLPFLQRAVLVASICATRAGNPRTGAIYKEYKKIAPVLGLRIITIQYLHKILESLDQQGAISRRVVSGKGRTSEISIDIEQIIDVLLEDRELMKIERTLREAK